jgi:mono/diheme cytochrome c family protein
MNKQAMLKAVIGAIAGVMVLTVAPESAIAQGESGADVWARTCARCHRMLPPTKYDSRHWKPIVQHMALNARLTSDEEDAVREFLMGTAAPMGTVQRDSEPSEAGRLAGVDPTIIAALMESGGAGFKKQCVACHGDTGRGDGPAAVALNPKPTDMTDPERMGDLTDAQLLEIVANGRASMPGFGAVLSPEELEAVVKYVRSLSASTDP